MKKKVFFTICAVLCVIGLVGAALVESPMLFATDTGEGAIAKALDFNKVGAVRHIRVHREGTIEVHSPLQVYVNSGTGAGYDYTFVNPDPNFNKNDLDWSCNIPLQATDDIVVQLPLYDGTGVAKTTDNTFYMTVEYSTFE
jgi:hypothetical protein